jgi:long-subunit fatty acid transport protein
MKRVALALLLGAAPAAAQQDPGDYFNPEDFSSEALYATSTVILGARATGLGGAYTAVSDDVAGLQYNPAGLAQIVRVEAAFGLRHLRDDATHSMFGAAVTQNTNVTGLDYIGFAYPVPTYRGSLVFAAAVQRARDNEIGTIRIDRRSDVGYTLYDEFRRRQEGGLWRYGAGFGLDVAPSLSVGAGLAYWHGSLRDNQYRSIDETFAGGPSLNEIDQLQSEATVNGFGFDLGLLGHVGRYGRIGVRLASPVWLDIEGDAVYTHDDLNSPSAPTSEYFYISQQPRLPWSATVGGALSLGGMLLASADVVYTAWDEVDLDDLPTGSPPLVAPNYSGTVGGRAGGELSLRNLPLRFRGGFAYEPLAYDLMLGNAAEVQRDRRTWSAGAGLLIAQHFALDVGASYSEWQRSDREFDAVFETRRERRILLSTAYRY